MKTRLWRWTSRGIAAGLLAITIAGGAGAGIARGQSEGCFSSLHAKDQPRDADFIFDLRFDKSLNGGSFSCDLDIRASDARKALDDFRFGVLYDSEPHIAQSVSFPLNVSIKRTLTVTEKPETIRIESAAKWIAFKKARLDKFQIAQIACASILNVGIVTGRAYGFFVGDGLVWFKRAEPGPKVKVFAVNLYPVDPVLLANACTR